MIIATLITHYRIRRALRRELRALRAAFDQLG